MTPIQASLKFKENGVDNNIREKRKERKAKFKIGDLVRFHNL